MAAMRSPRMPTSAKYHGPPAPSTMRPPAMMTSKGADCAVAAPIVNTSATAGAARRGMGGRYRDLAIWRFGDLAIWRSSSVARLLFEPRFAIGFEPRHRSLVGVGGMAEGALAV